MHFDLLILHWPGSELLLANKFYLLNTEEGSAGLTPTLHSHSCSYLVQLMMLLRSAPLYLSVVLHWSFLEPFFLHRLVNGTHLFWLVTSQPFGLLSVLIYDSMGSVAVPHQFASSIPRLPKLLFWCLSELNPALVEPAKTMMNKDSRFSRKMQGNFSTRRHSCIGYVSFWDYSEGSIVPVLAHVREVWGSGRHVSVPGK